MPDSFVRNVFFLMAFSLNLASTCFGHSNWSVRQYTYTDLSGRKLTAELWLTDSLIFQDPARFRVLDENKKVIYQINEFYHDVIVTDIDRQTGGSTIYAFDIGWPIARKIFQFDGSRFMETVSWVPFAYSPFLQFWRHGWEYLFLALFVLFSSRLLRLKSRPLQVLGVLTWLLLAFYSVVWLLYSSVYWIPFLVFLSVLTILKRKRFLNAPWLKLKLAFQ